MILRINNFYFMKLAISQPTFLPWCGYIGLIDHVDKFVFLDDVQFDKRSWQQRNYIKFNNDKHLITVPIKSKNKRFQKINEAEIDHDINFIDKHKKKIFYSYSKSKFYDQYSEDIFKIYDKKHKKILDFNLDLITYFCKCLNIQTKFEFSSNMKTKEKKQDLILEISILMKCKEYISTLGSKSYLDNEKKFKDNRIDLYFYNYQNIAYNQLGKNFIKNLSFLDLLFNLGKDSRRFIKKNFFLMKDKNI